MSVCTGRSQHWLRFHRALPVRGRRELQGQADRRAGGGGREGRQDVPRRPRGTQGRREGGGGAQAEDRRHRGHGWDKAEG